MLCSADNYALLDLPFFQFTEDLGLSYAEGRKKQKQQRNGILIPALEVTVVRYYTIFFFLVNY